VQQLFPKLMGVDSSSSSATSLSHAASPLRSLKHLPVRPPVGIARFKLSLPTFREYLLQPLPFPCSRPIHPLLRVIDQRFDDAVYGLSGCPLAFGEDLEQAVHSLAEFDGDFSHLSPVVVTGPVRRPVDPLALSTDYSVVAPGTAHATAALVLKRCVVERIDASAAKTTSVPLPGKHGF